MIEVTVETRNYEGGWEYAATADANDPEHAIFVARNLWDDAYTGRQGCARRVTFRAFGPEAPPEGIVARRTEERP